MNNDLRYPGAKTAAQSPDDHYYISTGAKENYYTLRHRFFEQTFFKDETGVHEGGGAERDYHLRNLSIDRDQALAEAKRLTGLEFNAEFDVRPIGERRAVDWSILQGGKYAGKSIHEVRESDEKYLLWLAENVGTASSTYGKTVELIKALLQHELEQRSDERVAQHVAAQQRKAAVVQKLDPVIRELLGLPADLSASGTVLSDTPDSLIIRFPSGLELTHYKRDDRWEGAGFVASVTAGLKNGELPAGRGLAILIDILAKKAGRSGSKAYNARREEVAGLLEDGQL